MKTIAKHPVRAKNEIDWSDVFVYSVVAMCILPFCIAGLVVQSIDSLGLTIFAFGTWLVIRQSDHGWITALIALAYTAAGCVAVWNHQWIVAGLIAVAAIVWEAIRPRFITPKSK